MPSRNLGDRPAVRRRVRLPAHGRELPEFRRSVRRHPGPAGDALRHSHDAVRHRHDPQRALPDGRDHGGRRRLGELHPAGHVRARAAARRQGGVRGRDRCRAHPHSARADDGGRDDRRHDPDGDRRRGRGAECRAGARRHRRPAVRDARRRCWSCPTCLRCCARGTTASRPTAYSTRKSHERPRTLGSPARAGHRPRAEAAPELPAEKRPHSEAAPMGRPAAGARRVALLGGCARLRRMAPLFTAARGRWRPPSSGATSCRACAWRRCVRATAP